MTERFLNHLNCWFMTGANQSSGLFIQFSASNYFIQTKTFPPPQSVSPTFVCSSSFLSEKATPGPEILKGRRAAARLRVELEIVENMMTSLCSQLYSDLSHHTSLPVLSSSQKQTEITRNPLWSKEMTWKFPKV